ncbi:MAG TPA: alpha/beta fold hydrolase [Rhizomicrobium sp.]|nr:alpha/beta fold hydrolase [Rhizomicrobium sp.]
MQGAYRFGFETASGEDLCGVDEARWSLVGADPSLPLLSGQFPASDGASVPYRLWPARAPRALLLCLHGAFDFCGSFDEIGPELRRHGFAVLAIDQRGFGRTASRGRWSGKTRMTEDVVDAARFLRARYGHSVPLFVLGESMGAAVAVHAAARDPSFSGLVLVAPGAVTGGWQKLLGAYIMRAVNAILPDSAFTAERISAWEYTPGAGLRLMCDPLVLRRARPAMLLGLFRLAISAVDAARSVRVPALTLVGGRDDLLRLACIARLHAELAGPKQWRLFRFGPHLLLHWKHRERVLSRIVRWLDGQLASGCTSEFEHFSSQVPCSILPGRL